MGEVMSKKAAHIDKADVIRRSQDGEGLNLLEASVRYSIDYGTLCRWARDEGLPVEAGKLFDVDFIAWRQQRAGLGAASSPNSAARRSRGTAGKSCEYLR